MSRVDAIIHQRTEPIDLQCASVLTTFQKNLVMVTCAREKKVDTCPGENSRIEAGLEATAGATYDQSHDEADTQTASLEKTISTPEAEQCTDWSCDWDCTDYNSDDDQCGCYSSFGKDDDGEVRHYGLNCEYRF